MYIVEQITWNKQNTNNQNLCKIEVTEPCMLLMIECFQECVDCPNHCATNRHHGPWWFNAAWTVHQSNNSLSVYCWRKGQSDQVDCGNNTKHGHGTSTDKPRIIKMANLGFKPRLTRWCHHNSAEQISAPLTTWPPWSFWKSLTWLTWILFDYMHTLNRTLQWKYMIMK